MKDAAPAKPAPTDLFRPAAAALGLSVLVWFGLLRILVADEKSGLATLFAVLGLASLALAAGVWTRKPLALGYALIAAWLVAGSSAYWAYSFGLTFLWLSTGLALASAFLISVGRPRVEAPAAAAAPPSDADSFAQWAKENVEAIVVAFIMALVIRCFCIEVFKIPSSSMEPTLLGDVTDLHTRGTCGFGAAHVKDGGDRIMVTKYYYSFSPVERFDVLVFKFPLNQSRNFIKRVVGLPNEELMIQHGNLFVRPAGSPEKPRVARRPLRVQDSVWIPLGPGPGQSFLDNDKSFMQGPDSWSPSVPDGQSGPAFAVEEKELRTQESAGRRSSEFRFRGELQQDRAVHVDDLRLAFDFEITSPKGAVFAEIENRFGRFEVVLGTDEESRLVWKGADREDRALIDKARLAPDHRYRFELFVLDGCVYVRLDGKLHQIDYATHPDQFTPVASPRHGIRFGTRDLTFRVRNLSVSRDIHYRGRPPDGLKEGEVVTTDADEYVMMGDNVGSSHDSRAWIERVIPLKDGRRIRFEAQEWNSSRETSREKIQERYGLPEPPDDFVAFDDQGTHWAIYTTPPKWPIPPHLPVVVLDEKQLDQAKAEEKAFRTIKEKFIVGKALWIWWPPGRWGRLIR